MKEITPRVLRSSHIETPLGTMVAIADEEVLYLLEFSDSKNLQQAMTRLKQKTQSNIIAGSTCVNESIEKELFHYFQGQLREFKTPLFYLGSPFQQRVWEELRKIPIGETRSYAHIAQSMERHTAYRAVARANSSNRLAILIPCHRVINSNGALGGYAGGLERKQWLLEHEKLHAI